MFKSKRDFTCRALKWTFSRVSRAYDAPKMSWTNKSCACLDRDIPSEKRSNLSYWIYIALFVLSFNETQKNYACCMVSLSRDSYSYQKLSQSYYTVFVYKRLVWELELKGVGDCGLINGYFIFIECYISQIRSLRYSGIWHRVRKYVVMWPG